ncbi:MAG: PilZ domain-containing protein [Candidatus Omnitrophica bacterium]|nr:PilZ domain-containing protein [Candidatus Omnitrophota bacterium]
MIERRRYPRYKARILIKYRRVDSSLSKWQDNPQVENISLGGMLFNAYEKLPVSTELVFNVHIFIEESITKIIELRGKVVGVEEGVISYPTRVAFFDLDQKAKSDLIKFVDYLK